VYKYTVGLLNNAFKVDYSLGLYCWVNVKHANKQQKNVIDSHFHSQINMHESLDLQQLYKPHPDSTNHILIHTLHSYVQEIIANLQ